MTKIIALLFVLSTGNGFAQEQLCAKLDTVVASADGSLFLRLEGIKRSFYTRGGHKESSLTPIIAIAKAHEMKICLEGFGEFEEIQNRQLFQAVRLY